MQINAQRDLIANFSTNLVARLGTLSADATNLLASCRASVDAAVTTNELVIENVLKAVNDLRSNTANIKTVLPTVTQSVDFVTNGVKSQIDETTKMRAEHEKCSDEQTAQMTSMTESQKDAFAAAETGISKMIESTNSHTKLFAATMKSSKVKIVDPLEKQLTVEASACANIKSKIADGIGKMKNTTDDIIGVVNDTVQNLKVDSQTSLNFKQTVATFVTSFGASSKKKFDNLRNIVRNFHGNDLKVYSSSGKLTFTPSRSIDMQFSY